MSFFKPVIFYTCHFLYGNFSYLTVLIIFSKNINMEPDSGQVPSESQHLSGSKYEELAAAGRPQGRRSMLEDKHYFKMYYDCYI